MRARISWMIVRGSAADPERMSVVQDSSRIVKGVTKRALALAGCLWLLAGACGPSRLYGVDPEDAGGSAGAAGDPGLAGSGGGSTQGATSCLSWSASVSPKIRTVGIVTFTTPG